MINPHEIDQEIGEINVTPLVDVMLVLLIIFMITAPFLMQGIAVSLPKAQAKAFRKQPAQPLILTIDKEGEIYLEKHPLSLLELQRRLPALMAIHPGEPIYLKADGQVPYERVIRVLDAMDRLGFHDIGLVTESGEE